MPNWAYTQYKFKGSESEVAALHKTFPAFLVFSQETIARLKRGFGVIESAIISSSSKSMTMVQSG